MKKSRMVCALGILAATFGSAAKAVPVNPANWDWSVVTLDEARDDDGPLSPPVEPGWPVYEYEWQLTHIDNELDPWPALEVANINWVDIWDGIPLDERSGNGSHDGSLPFSDELFLHIEYPVITADFFLSVDENGYGTVSIANIIFGQIEDLHNPGTYYDITGARFQGNGTITGIPEPATLVLLGAGGVWILSRKKRSA